MERKTPKAIKLHDLQQWYWDAEKKTERHVSTLFWNLPYGILKLKKEIEEKKNYPKGTFFKIVPNS